MTVPSGPVIIRIRIRIYKVYQELWFVCACNNVDSVLGRQLYFCSIVYGCYTVYFAIVKRPVHL